MESYFPATSEALGLSPKKKKPEPEPEPEKSAVTAYVLKLKEVLKNAYEKRNTDIQIPNYEFLQTNTLFIPIKRLSKPSKMELRALEIHCNRVVCAP